MATKTPDQAPDPAAGGVEEPDLSDEESAILDQVWDEIAAAEKAK
jgi:hypothetical protein